MVLVKVLGGIDLAAAFAFLMLAFGVNVFTAYLLFCAALLFTKSLFILTGDVLSILDLIGSIFLIMAIFFTLPSVILWIPAFLLMAKGFVSFL